MPVYKWSGCHECRVSHSLSSESVFPIHARLEFNLMYCPKLMLYSCQACQDFYGLGGSFSIEDWKGYCAERKFEIAPVPASIVSSWSVFNATMTANTARETGAGTNTVNSAKASTTSSRVTAVTFSDTTLILPTVTFANKQSTVTGTITFLGDPTGSFVPGPLTTTTGMAPLQNAPAGSGANTALAGEIVKMLSIGFATFSLMAAVVVVL